jgi:HEAT repeat protein
MYQFISKNKLILLVFFFVFIFTITGRTQERTIPQRTAAMLETLKGIESTNFKSTESEALIEEVFSNKKSLKQAEPLLNEFFLEDKGIAGKRYLMSELAKAKTPAAVNYLAGLLTYEPSASLALMHLQTIPGEQVDELLRSYFTKASPNLKPGIINALGLRQHEKSVSFISKFLDDKDSVFSASAVFALGKIGTPKATAALTNAIKSSGPEKKLMLAEALLLNAEQLEADNQPESAYEIYSTVLSVNPPTMSALAAIKGKINTSPGNEVDILKEELGNAPDELMTGLIGLVRMLPESYKSGRELLKLPGIPENDKVRLIVILAERNDKSILNDVLKFLDHEEPFYRESAILALSEIAEVESVPLLVKLASERNDKEQELARRAIYRLPGKEIDSFIIKKIEDAENLPHTVEYIRATAERMIPSAQQVLIRTAKNENQEVRLESYRSLAKVGTANHLDEIIDLLVTVENTRERQELERTVILVSTKEGLANPLTKEIVTRLNTTAEPGKKAILISVLGSLKNPDDLDVLLAYLNSEDIDLQLSAVRALSEWPNAGPAAGLKEIIGKTDDLRVKTLALRGFTQVIVNDINLSNEKKAGELKFAISQAPNVNEKKLVISAFGKVPSPESLTMLSDMMADNENPLPELEAAVLSIAPQLINQDRETTIKELNRILEYTDNDEIRKWIE